MSLSYVSRDGRLITAHEGSDFAAVQALLRKHDEALRLVPRWRTDQGTTYAVYRWYGPERPSELIAVWADEKGNPLPLSSALLDEVQKRDRNMRGFTASDVDQHNQRLVEQQRKDHREETREMAKEYGERIDGKKNTILPRSISLRMARDKVRNRQRYPELRP